MARAQSIISRYFDGRLGGGIGLNDFLILYYLTSAEGNKLRRVDLAHKMGFTPSGVTRLLAPMEKIGLIKREPSQHDARVSYVSLAPSGQRILQEEFERAELLAQEVLPSSHEVGDFEKFLSVIGKVTS